MFATKTRRIAAAALILATLSQSALAAGFAAPGSSRMFNPQPDPPGQPAPTFQQTLRK